MRRARLAEALGALDAGRVAVFLLLLLPAVMSLRHPIADPDLWWHLKTGEWIVDHRAVPREDPFSYTALGHPWIAYSWLAEVLFYAIVQGFGFGALLVFKAAVVVATTGLIYLSCRGTGARLPAAIAASALAGMATFGAWGERPQVLTLLFLAALVWGLRSPRMQPKLTWMGPLLVALWTNVHILFAAGVAVLAVATVCAAIEGRPSRALALTTLGAALATLANPYGWKLLAHVGTIAYQPRLIRAVTEFQSPDFGSQLGVLVGAFLLFAIGTLAMSRERMTPFELITFLVPLAMGLYMIRNMALFAILAAPTVARHLDATLPRSVAQQRPNTGPVWHWLPVVAGLALLVSLLPRAKSWRENVEPGVFPVVAADFIAAHHSGVHLFNHFNWGGFLIYQLFPTARVSIDGRTAVYEPNQLDAYLRTQDLGEGWQRFLEDCHPDLVIWPAQHPLSILLRRSSEWRVAFEDDVAVVFARKANP